METKTERATRTQAEWRAKNHERHKATQISIRYHLKLEVIALYGGCCSCCGITVVDSLTIDHVHGGGRAETREAGSKKSLWYPARAEHGSGKYQLLCMNCNHSKHVNGGTCCHQGGTPKESTSRSVKADRKLRAGVIAALGGRCVCCGEDELGFLTVDHIKEDGSEHRANRGPTGSLRDIRDGGCDTTRYQVLCFNCNLNKAISGGGACLCKTGRVVEPPAPRKLVKVTLLSPDGELFEVENLKRFCEERGLHDTHIHKVMSGKHKSHKGWTVPK